MNFSGNFKANKAINVFVQRLNQSRKSIRAAKPQQKKVVKNPSARFLGNVFPSLTTTDVAQRPMPV